ncbi:MAG: hypothetical protein E2O39_06975 [Planctomycetota bacterium]|nr:MAG: hypothetical protein E2O39_06975 [Planctomycetota bacterium]
MKLRNPSIWIAVLSTVSVVCLVAVDLRSTSPGAIIAVHGRESDLSGRSGCAQCHGGDGVTMGTACLECHGEVREDIELGDGMHGLLAPNVGMECAMCHSEHHGEDFIAVNLRSFVIAGVPDPAGFEHELVGYEMGGAHLALECKECHVFAEEPLLPEGGRRYMGLDQDCTLCHLDPHESSIPGDCSACHVQDAFDDLTPFEHDERFPLVGGHADPGCLDCHPRGTDHSVEVLAGIGPKPSPRDCQDCHSSPHADAFIAGVAPLFALTARESCSVCHEAEHEGFRDVGLRLTLAEHAASGFPLEAPHGDSACADCHLPEAEDFDGRYPGRVFRGEPAGCESCHEDAHRGFFDSASARFGASEAGECARCHVATTFADIPAGRFDHGLWTGFPVVGAHAQSRCEVCHPPTVGPNAQGRTFGWATDHFGLIEGCATCHMDPHGGSFEAPSLAREIEGRTGCARCHVETSFRTFPDGFDHLAWTGFGLAGAHGETSCASCHPPVLKQPTGRTFARAVSRDCADCHGNPHAGQFTENGVSDCLGCHASTVSFAELDFDHDRDSSYPLDEAHRALACSECHKPWKLQGDVEIVRYKPLGMACTDCHGVEQGKLRTKNRYGVRR